MAKKAKAKVEEKNTLIIAKKAIEKKYGNIISYLSEHEELGLDIVSTGSLGLDAALGVGGVALGRIYEFFGSQGSGKSSLAFSVIVEAQKRGLNCAYVDAEHTVSAKLLKNMGIDDKKLIVVTGHTGEENLDAAEMVVKSGDLDVLVIDSVSSLIPRAEADENIDHNPMGLLARLMSKCMRRFTPLASQSNTLIIFINQIRMDIGKYGDPRKPTGGEALSFFATGRIRVSGGESKSSRINDANGVVIGHKIVFEVLKNKLAPPYRGAEIPLIYGAGFDRYGEVCSLAVDLDIINKSGAWYSYKDENIAQGENNAVVFLKENKDVYKEIRGKVKDMLGLSHE
jgi:recombination protein RecA